MTVRKFSGDGAEIASGGPEINAAPLKIEAAGPEIARDGMSWPLVHPLGPLWSLPPLLRQFIRTYTQHRAAKANDCRRDRLEQSPRRIGSVNKYIGPYSPGKRRVAFR